MSPKKVSKQRHDSFIKKIMSNPKVAKEFFECHLPSLVQEKIDLNTLHPQKESFVENALGRGVMDMLFSVKFSKGTGYLYVLLEQQSKEDYYMAYRIHKYMCGIIDNHRRQNPEDKYLPLVYPLIFYTGLEDYNAPLTLWELFADPNLARSFFMGPFQLIELQKIDDEELRKRVWAGTMQFVMKRIFEKDILPFLETIRPLLQEIGKQDFAYIESVLWYTLETAESGKTEKVVEIFKEVVSEEERGKIMSIADRIREEGIQLGKQEGIQLGKQEGIQLGEQRGIQLEKKHIANNMLAEGQSVSFISKVTGLSETEIKELKQSKLSRN